MVTRKRWFEPVELMLSTEKWLYVITQMRADNLIDRELCGWLDAVEAGWTRVQAQMTLDDPEQLEQAEVAFRYAHYMGWVQHMDYVALQDMRTTADIIKEEKQKERKE